MKKFVGTGYNPSQDIINTNGRDDGRTKNGETEGFTNPKKQKVEEPMHFWQGHLDRETIKKQQR